jgi:hypothetical protein
MRLDRHDYVMGAWADSTLGVIWVCVRSHLDGRCRIDAIQPDDQTPNMIRLVPFLWMAGIQMMAEIDPEAERMRKRKGRR